VFELDKEKIKVAIVEIDKKIDKCLKDSDYYTYRVLQEERKQLIKLLTL